MRFTTMPSQRNRQNRAQRTICYTAAQLQECHREDCTANHSLFDTAILQYCARDNLSRSRSESSMTLEYKVSSDSACWTARSAVINPHGGTVLAEQAGATPQYALRLLCCTDVEASEAMKIVSIITKSTIRVEFDRAFGVVYLGSSMSSTPENVVSRSPGRALH